MMMMVQPISMANMIRLGHLLKQIGLKTQYKIHLMTGISRQQCPTKSNKVTSETTVFLLSCLNLKKLPAVGKSFTEFKYYVLSVCGLNIPIRHDMDDDEPVCNVFCNSAGRCMQLLNIVALLLVK